MSALPFEILTSIFKPLKSNDLAQCQLVCRSWNQASLKILYSDVNLYTEKRCKLYIRTIKSAPKLAKFLEIIKAGIVCYCETEEDYDREDLEEKLRFNNWDRHGLLNTIIDLCPNVLKILNRDPSDAFWTKLLIAAARGQLSRLQYVTYPGTLNFLDYAIMAFAFRKTLKTLELPDKVPRDYIGSEFYPTFCESLNQFPCLQTLELSCSSKHQLSYYGAIIDKCRELINLIIHPVPYRNETLIAAKDVEGIIKSHTKIESLQCSWPIVNSEEQIAYIMQKFPNLKSLTVNRGYYDCEDVMQFSVNTLLKLLRYMISLKKGAVSIILNQEDCVDPYISIINEKIKTIDITISIFSRDNGGSNPVVTRFTGNTLSFSFPTYTDHHIKLLTEIGKKVRSLTLDIHIPPFKNLENIDQIIELINLCPSLQHLKLVNLKKLFCSDSIDYQNFELESLSLRTYDHTIGSLEKISFIFPNLKILHLFIPPLLEPTETITIDMPYTSFDILICSVVNDYWFDIGLEIYVRLKTDAGLQFYSASSRKLQQRKETELERLHLDIICRSLTKLKIDSVEVV